MRPIDGDALMERMEKRFDDLSDEHGHYDAYDDLSDEYRYYDGYVSGFGAAMALADSAPALDVEPVRHGRWVFADSDWWESEVHCSFCGWRHAPVHPAAWMRYGGHRYCGACGAKMDLEVAK